MSIEVKDKLANIEIALTKARTVLRSTIDDFCFTCDGQSIVPISINALDTMLEIVDDYMIEAEKTLEEVA